jgi:hypothetical protein
MEHSRFLSGSITRAISFLFISLPSALSLCLCFPLFLSHSLFFFSIFLFVCLCLFVSLSLCFYVSSFISHSLFVFLCLFLCLFMYLLMSLHVKVLLAPPLSLCIFISFVLFQSPSFTLFINLFLS